MSHYFWDRKGERGGSMQIVVESMRGRVTPTGDAERYCGTTTIMFSFLVFVFCFVVAFTSLHWKQTLVREEPSFFFKVNKYPKVLFGAFA